MQFVFPLNQTQASRAQVTNPFVSGTMDNVINDLVTGFIFKKQKKIRVPF
jgi:hypothetical protein